MKDYIALSLTLLLSMHPAFSMEESMEKDKLIKVNSLFRAIKENDYQEVSDLLTEDPSLANSADNSALIVALSRGAQPDCQSRTQEQQNNLVIIKLLLVSGADPNEGPPQFKALDVATKFNSARHKKLLEKHGALSTSSISEISPVEQEKRKLREQIELIEQKKKTIE